jgi:hypothetical protein
MFSKFAIFDIAQVGQFICALEKWQEGENDARTLSRDNVGVRPDGGTTRPSDHIGWLSIAEMFQIDVRQQAPGLDISFRQG